jgi:tetratricopeptide (TPR) repeat protein
MKKKILIVLLFTIFKVGAQTSTFFVVDSLFEKGRYQLALKELDAKQPSFLSNYKKAVIYESIDNYGQTLRYLEKALSFKENKKASLKLAKVYQRLRKPKVSIGIYENLLAKDSLNLVLAYQLGKLYLKTKNHQKSIAIFKSLIKKDSTNAHYSYQLGLSYAFAKERDCMINSFIDTYKKDTAHIRVLSKLALSFLN